ncbi:MAG: phage major capsid protein [Clostridiales bacterium]|jgi:HK97 family phage major capsid protein|nr:phage major capsid protein [Clostridiales bacterium]
MNLKELKDKRAALLAQIAATTDEKRFAELQAEVKKTNFLIEESEREEREAAAAAATATATAAAQREAELRAARAPANAPAQISGGNTESGIMRAAFNLNPAANAANASGARTADRLDTPEYRAAFMAFVQNGTPIPTEYRRETRANQITATGDAGAVIPTTLVQDIIRELHEYGSIYAGITKLNVQGGLEWPISTLVPTASWIGETSVSETQKLEAKTKITFSYYGLECRISQTLLANITTLEVFQKLFTTLAVEAIVKALDLAVFNGTGSGQPLGITKDARVPAANKITLLPDEFKKLSGWKSKVFAKMKKAYRNGTFFMAQGTFDGYIDGMVDRNGQPVGRINYGIDGGEVYRFGGRRVETVEDAILPNYDDAETGDLVAVYCDLKDYAFNSNMEFTAVKWIDHDTNEVKNKVLLIADGKLIRTYGVLLIYKGAATPPAQQ